MAQLSVALNTARQYLNDVGGNTWSFSGTSDNLIPFAQEAHRELQARLWGHGSPVVRAQSAAILVNSGATNLGGSQPSDMLTPFRVVEYAQADVIANATEVTEVVFIPQEAQQATLQYWCWIDEILTFLGATTNRNVVIFYRKLLPIPNITTDPIGVLFGELYMSAAIAAKAHGSLGNKTAYDTLIGVAEKNLNIVYESQRGQQTPTVRP